MPVAKDGAKIKYGPYSAVAAYGGAAGRVHYENNAPFGTLTSAVREVEVSMWGNVAVEEHYALAHTGAALKGGFSRLEYQMKAAKGASFDDLTAILPAGATDVYYRDIIGNISTSHVRSELSRTVMEINPRFPMFGGWKTEWYQGYNVAAGPYLTANDDGSFTLAFDANLPFADLPVRDYALRVVLPEAATVVSAEAPFPADISTSRRFTYLDGPSFGRPIAVFRAKGTTVSSGAYTGDVKVTFTVPPAASMYKPAYLTAAFFAAFLAAIVGSRINLSLSAAK